MKRLIALTLLLAACDEFATPSELESPRIIALTAEPASVEPGTEGVLEAVVAGPAGLMAPRVFWTLDAPVDGVTLWSDGVDRIAVADGVAETTITLRAEVDLGGDTLVGVRQLVVGGPARANPTIDLMVDGAVAGTEIALPVGGEIDIAVLVDPAEDPIDGAGVSWFATAGEIPHYRRTPAVLEAPDDAASGLLLAVYRDGLGGVAWRQWTVDFNDL